MNVLSIDYGDKRIGLAYGSTEHRIAFGLMTIQNGPQLWQELLAIIIQYAIEHILVGMPLSLESKDTPQTSKVRSFYRDLASRYSITMEEIDERFSSKIAKQYLPRHQSLDVESARLLLAEWFEKSSK